MVKFLEIQLVSTGNHIFQRNPIARAKSVKSMEELLGLVAGLSDSDIRGYKGNKPRIIGYGPEDALRIRQAYEQRVSAYQKATCSQQEPQPRQPQ